MADSKTIIGISKFNNIGGITCYMNSILHIVQQIPIFADYIYIAPFFKTIIQKFKDEDKIKETVAYELHRLLKVSMTNDDVPITPSSFKHIIGQKNDMWNEMNHQDSQEFYTFLISTLEDEIGTKVKFIPGGEVIKPSTYLTLLAESAWQRFQSREYSILKNIFEGLLYTQTKCNCCYNKSITFEPFVNLQVSIPMDPKTDRFKDFTLSDCLNHFVKEEQLDKDNKYNCEMCGLLNRGHKTTLLWKTPKVLVIHIKRFLIDNYGRRSQKLINNIEYPIYDLDMSPYIHPESPDKDKAKYNLIGINLHQEFGYFGTNSGHYTSMVKNRFDNNWYLFNDGNKLGKPTRREHLQNRNAYLLFYYRDDNKKVKVE